MRLKTGSRFPSASASPGKTLKTSVVAPPMSTPTALMPSRSAICRRIRPTAPGVGMMAASAIAISFS